MGWVPSKHVAGPALSNAHTSNCGKCYSSLFWNRSSFSLPVMNTVLFLLCFVCFSRPACKEGGSHWNIGSHTIYSPVSRTPRLFWSEFKAWCTELAIPSNESNLLQKAIRTDTSNILNVQHNLSSFLISFVYQGPPQGSCHSTACRDLHLGDKHCPPRSMSLLGWGSAGTNTNTSIWAWWSTGHCQWKNALQAEQHCPFLLYLDAMMSPCPPVLQQHSWSWLCNAA